MEKVHIYADGACSPNPGTGGWGTILIAPDRNGKKELYGAEKNTTNNRMELIAVIRGLEALKIKPCDVVIYTDSQYIVNAFNQEWIKNWENNGWRTSANKPVKNQDLWTTLLDLCKQHVVNWQWIKGHDQNEHNIRCDNLAVTARLNLAAGL